MARLERQDFAIRLMTRNLESDFSGTVILNYLAGGVVFSPTAPARFDNVRDLQDFGKLRIRMSEMSTKEAVLVVEDESILRMMAVDLFEDAGFRVLEAASGEQAIGLLRANPTVAGIFTDVELTGPMDGFGLARLAHDAHPAAAIIVVSGCKRPAEDDLPDGARFIAKPYDGAFVVDALNEMLRG